MFLSEDKIRTLSNREQARDKISVWYGSADNYVHGLKEILANATDEIINNFDSGEIFVELLDDNKTIIVRDTGRGIPINGETDGIPNYELLFKTLFAGTKYGEQGKTDGSYTGSNGLGTCILNYTSELFECKSVQNGKSYTVTFTDGGELVGDLVESDTDEDNGTTMTFKLDAEVYTETEYNNEQVKDIVKRYAVSSSKITIHYRHKDEYEKYHYDSVEDYFEEIAGDSLTSSVAYGSPVLYEDDGENTTMQVAFSTATTPVQESYLNLTYMEYGGAINDGVINGIKLSMNKHCRDNGLFPKNVKSFTDADIEDSISFVAVVLSNKVEFENQTKLSTQKKLYREIAKKHAQSLLEVMELEDKKGFDAIVNHLLLVQKENTVNQKQRAKLKKKLAEKVDNLSNKIDKFVDCRVHGEEAELYLAEGDSAHGSIVLARDGRFQASLPMGGKFLNVAKASSLDTIFDNEIIMNVVKVLGCGVDLGKKYKDLPPFDISKLRYGKIICASDEDPDGASIISLIITLFHRLMPEIIKSGKLYIARTPLYEIKLNDDSVIYEYTDEGRDKVLEEYGNKVVNIARSKGLGELEAEVMAETAMNPETRHLTQVCIEDAVKAEQAIEDWMGDDVENRKEFISQNLNKYLEVASE